MLGLLKMDCSLIGNPDKIRSSHILFAPEVPQPSTVPSAVLNLIGYRTAVSEAVKLTR